MLVANNGVTPSPPGGLAGGDKHGMHMPCPAGVASATQISHTIQGLPPRCSACWSVLPTYVCSNTTLAEATLQGSPQARQYCQRAQRRLYQTSRHRVSWDHHTFGSLLGHKSRTAGAHSTLIGQSMPCTVHVVANKHGVTTLPAV